MLSDSEVELSQRQYGKNYVRLLYVRRDSGSGRHAIKELEVNTALSLSSTKDYTVGDNGDIIATDSQKNTVYILAKQFGIRTIEEFALRLANHFVTKYPQVVTAKIHVIEKPWKRIAEGKKEHVHAFELSGEATRFCDVELTRNKAALIWAGLKDLTIMKTTKSAFKDFVRDEYRSLPDTDDRIFMTTVYAKWKYSTTQIPNFDRAWDIVRSSVVETFAGPADQGVFSPSVQKTLYDSEKLAMARLPQIEEIHIEFPNIHAYQVDFSKFPALHITTNTEVFQPSDKPSGNIQATLRRKNISKL